MKSLENKKTTLASKQARSAIALGVAVVLLIAVLAVVIHFIRTNAYRDAYTYTDKDGTEYTIDQLEDGTYGLFYADGTLLDSHTDNGVFCYVTDAGTKVTVSKTGVAKEYTGSKSAYNPLTTKNLESIHVDNSLGSFTFALSQNKKWHIKEYENAYFDDEKFSKLRSMCLYPYYKYKVSDHAYKSFGLAEYGLDQPKSTVSIYHRNSDGRLEVIKMYVGNEIVSGGDLYYVRYQGTDYAGNVIEDAVYISHPFVEMSDYLHIDVGELTLSTVESFVHPVLAYPVTSTSYMEVYNFWVNRHHYDQNGELSLDPEVGVTFTPLSDRENTEYTTLPYTMIAPTLKGYTPSPDAVYTVMNPHIMMEGVKLVKLLDPSKESYQTLLEQYGLDRPEKSMYYESVVKDEAGKPYYVKNQIFVSKKTENDTYYATATVLGSSDGENYHPLAGYNQIVEADAAFFPFMEWTSVNWVQSSYFQMFITICEEMEFITNDYHVVFDVVPYDTDGKKGMDDVKVYQNTEKGRREVNVNYFKTLYLNLLGGTLFGTAEATDEEIARIMADPANHLLTFKVSASTGNQKTFSFYWLEESKALLAVDGVAEFYVLTSAVEKSMQDAIDVANNIKIEAVTPYTQIDK